jgi:hypothetical protein
MLNDFFRLNGQYRIFNTQQELINQLGISNDLRNVLYNPSSLVSTGQHPKLKIRNISFTNVSFSKTQIKQIVFINCKFEDCLFIGTEIDDCEFHNTTFKNCNPYKITIRNTYVNPKSFEECILKITNSNIAVHLFQQLLNNSDDKLQSKFGRIAEYNFKRWQDRLTISKYRHKKPYPISFWQFLLSYPINALYRLTFGYGLRLKNFILTFIVIFISFFLINAHNWKDYSLQKKDIKIEAFNSDSSNFHSNFFYTLDATTKIVDSQFQATSNNGMVWLTIENLFGFILLSGLITIILNRLVK